METKYEMKNGMNERNEMKERNREVKCLVWDEKENKIEISDFPPFGKLYVTGTNGFLFSKSFILDLTEIITKHSLEELIESGLITIFISKDDELVFRNDKYMHIETEQLQVGDVVIKYSIRKIKAEEEIVSAPASYWQSVGEAFVWKGNRTLTPAPRPERRGDRQVRVR